ncbi:MAG: mannose-1-phosphate guanylyltransferase [Paludibacteraceae bacterium]|nr:mannose-1-phosphate guanylyltransferase [Paludibacteraceae bacterium]
MDTNNNYCVIMAGGIGARFWPYSKNSRPKQFLDFFGTGRSLIQLTFDRFRQVVPAENILIVSNRLYKDLILEQLPELKPEQVLLEPMRRNTAPCIYYAVSRIKAKTEKANIIVAPSDHLIMNEINFLDTIRQGLDFIENNDALLTLGIKPSRPETGYGYIQIADGDGSLRKVKTFTEKPNLELAKVFFESGEFFWNSGIFLWNLQAIDKAFHELLPDIASRFDSGKGVYGTEKEDDFITEIYPSCENISIDYGVLEKASNVNVLCSDFGWSDLGTWGSLFDISPKDNGNNVTMRGIVEYYDAKDNVVAVPKNKLAVIQGLEDYIVAENDDVLLICRKADEQKIRQFVNDVSVKFNGKYI